MNIDMIDERNEATSDPSKRIRFDRREIEDYAKNHWRSSDQDSRWNGRQIKNAFQTAVALADWDCSQLMGDNPHSPGPLLRSTHFDTVAKASAHFDQYLREVRGTDESRAKMNEFRRDDIPNGLSKDSTKSTRKTNSSKMTTKSKQRKRRDPSTQSSDESSENSKAEEEASSSSGESESEEETPPPPKTKKSSKRKIRK